MANPQSENAAQSPGFGYDGRVLTTGADLGKRDTGPKRQRQLDLMRRMLTPISRECAQEISLRYRYEAMRKSIDKNKRLLDLFPPEFAAQIRKERSNG